MARTGGELTGAEVMDIMAIHAIPNSNLFYRDSSGNIIGLGIGTNLIVSGGNLNSVAGSGDMTKAIYDPENGAKQVAFKDNVYSKTETYNKTEVNNLLKNVGVNLFTLTETVVINAITYAQSCTLQTDSRYNSTTTSELTTGTIATTLDGIGAVSDEGIFSSLPETTATIHFYVRKTASNQADVNVQFKWYKLTSAGVATLIGTSSIATIDSTITKEYDLTVVLTPTTFAPTDRLLRVPTYTKVGGGVNSIVAVSVEGPSNYTFVTIPVSIQNISFAHNDTTGKQGGTTGEYYHLTSSQLTNLNNQSGTNTGDQDLSGLALKSTTLIINGTAQDLSANRTFTVSDANLSITDITTNNSSTTKHGFLPKLSGSATDVLKGDGTWGAGGGGGLSWGASITGTTGTGLTTTIGNSASAGTIGQSIVLGNTQTSAVTLLNINTGTSTGRSHNGILVTSGLDGNAFTQGASSTTGAGLVINTVSTGVAMVITGGTNCNQSNYGLFTLRLSGTQSGPTVAQWITLGASAQGHTGLLIDAKGASSLQIGCKIDMGSTGTGIPIELITSGTARTALKLSTGFRAATATTGTGQALPSFVDGYIIINVGGTAKKIPYFLD